MAVIWVNCSNRVFITAGGFSLSIPFDQMRYLLTALAHFMPHEIYFYIEWKDNRPNDFQIAVANRNYENALKAFNRNVLG